MAGPVHSIDLYWATSLAGPWIFIPPSIPKATLLAGYTFTPDPTAAAYQVRDTGLCATILSLTCDNVTTTSTTTDPYATTTSTTTGAGNVIPDHIWAPSAGNTYYVNLIFTDPATVLYSVDEDTWFTSSINPTVNVYSPTEYYMVMTVVVDANVGAERLSQIDIYDATLTLWGVVFMRQDGI